jgi:hypothetical protein
MQKDTNAKQLINLLQREEDLKNLKRKMAMEDKPDTKTQDFYENNL